MARASLSRCAQLKKINDIIYRLCDREDVTEDEIYRIVAADERFDRIRRSTVISTCKFLRKKKAKHPKNVRTSFEHTETRRYFTGPITLKTAVYELQQLNCKWSDRFFFLLNRSCAPDQTLHWFFLFDLYKNKTSQISAPKKQSNFIFLHHLEGHIGLIVEADRQFGTSPVFDLSLVYFSAEEGRFECIKTYKREMHLPRVYVDHSDPHKFIIRCLDRREVPFRKFIEICEWKDGEIKFFNRVYIEEHFFWNISCYYEDQFYAYNLPVLQARETSSGTISRLDVKAFSRTFIKLKPMPDEFVIAQKRQHDFTSEWINDRIYMSIRYLNSSVYGIAWASYSSPFWTKIEFAVKSPIEQIDFVDNSDLILQLAEPSKESSTIRRRQCCYKIPMRSPEFLCNLSWLQVVRTFKNKNVKQPYEKAQKLQPLNFDQTTSFLCKNF
ncbi:hypothetical protein M3Y97_00913700 [Aphelenchoides bicaudatus]|nr:hypothetical protein M3Y97_00913700 [Aphelenchoides bicaudatus]